MAVAGNARHRRRTASGWTAGLVIRESALSDFFARIVVQSDGRLNLQD
jgi:hypothetical protein